MIGGGFSPRLKKRAHHASGVYAVREKSSRRVVYVGESSRGNLWRTLLRHFQAPESFRAVRERGIFTGDPAKYEVAIEITSRGPRPRASAAARIAELKRQRIAYTTEADQKAMTAQARWIENFRKAGHDLVNVDDGLANDDDDGPRETTCPTCHGSGEDLMGDACETCRGSGRVVVGNPKAPTTGALVLLFSGRAKPENAARLHAASCAVVKRAKPHDHPQRFTGEDDPELVAVLLDLGEREYPVKRCACCAVKKNPSDLVQGGRVRHFASKKEAIAAGKRLVRRTGRPATVVTPVKGRTGRERWHTANPAPERPTGRLIELGILTRLDGDAWNLRDAPVLAYDAKGRLFIVYVGKVVRASTPTELREYARKHWGAKGGGQCSGGAIADGPFKRHGVSRSITYTTKKGGDAAPVDYVHAWGEGGARDFVAPTVLRHDCGDRGCAWDGALSLSGGSYTVSSRGIVG